MEFPSPPQPSKIICVGQNYAAHVREFGGELPSEPVLFQKAPSSWAAPFAPLELPPGAEKLDYEVELGIVIGKRAQRVNPPQPLKVGDTVELGIDGIGTISQEIITWKGAL